MLALAGCQPRAPGMGAPALDGPPSPVTLGADEGIDGRDAVGPVGSAHAKGAESVFDDADGELNGCFERALWPVDAGSAIAPLTRARSAMRQAQACRAQTPYAPACRELAIGFFGDEPELAVSRSCQAVLLAAACEAGDATGCVLHAATREVVDPRAARRLYARSCRAGLSAACWMGGAEERAFSCTPHTCGVLGAALARIAPAQRGPRANRLLDAAAALDPVTSMERARVAGRANDPRAADAYDDACALSGAAACRQARDSALSASPHDDHDLVHAVHLEAAICRAGDASACVHAALLSETDELSAAYLDAGDLLARGCAAGSPVACTMQGGTGPGTCDRQLDECSALMAELTDPRPHHPLTAYVDTQSLTPARVRAIAWPACTAGHRAACTALIAFDAVEAREDALTVLKHACSGNKPSARGCELLGVMLLETDEQAAEAALTRACRVGSGDACTSLATRIIAASNETLPPTGLTLLERGCDLGSVSACLLLADHFMTDPRRAAKYMGRAQALGYSGC